MRTVLALCLIFLAPVTRACETALLLSIDVSQSIDVSEYRLQVDGLADALRDPEIVDILVRDNVALSVVQWSGPDAQQVTIPWVRIRTALDVRALSDRARGMQRAFLMSNTAPAEALDISLRQFGQVADCKRKIVDISGDGTANAGSEVAPFRRRAERLGITVNAIAIEGLGVAITNYYSRKVITRDGFVITARGHRDYPRAIREKILREISQVIS
ncbi:DUF1194 domain-containing protein [Mesobacterium sp. TK19101]|uniref:DUF1194 domain-containing protein n=1 Tax=Mesobacterium hydrothermale TaxID=3111907 RepID=A0ABU6HFE2_9RHOB|nr:DUF1194 domain-containing protein [Mesobacterium sp. TK19101]MEC3860183.1 DUF1194 domain-containing protein [Mesobacterium sp. TK19101]